MDTIADITSKKPLRNIRYFYLLFLIIMSIIFVILILKYNKIQYSVKYDIDYDDYQSINLRKNMELGWLVNEGDSISTNDVIAYQGKVTTFSEYQACRTLINSHPRLSSEESNTNIIKHILQWSKKTDNIKQSYVDTIDKKNLLDLLYILKISLNEWEHSNVFKANYSGKLLKSSRQDKHNIGAKAWVIPANDTLNLIIESFDSKFFTLDVGQYLYLDSENKVKAKVLKKSSDNNTEVVKIQVKITSKFDLYDFLKTHNQENSKYLYLRNTRFSKFKSTILF